MGVRIQPRQIDIPEEDPFRNDLLDRKESAEVLTNLLGNMEGPCVLAVDAAWGTGKTTFLRMWTQHLRNEGFRVVELNAWETDFTGDPFLAVSSEITAQLFAVSDRPLRVKVARAREAAGEVAKRGIPAAIRLGTAGLLDLSPVFEKELGQALASYAVDRLGRFNEARGSLTKFKNSFEDMATTLSVSSEDRPLIVVIDELDRCRPNYAIELLEVAKHLFSVDHVVFVLAVNRSELAHSVKAIYGDSFGADGYLDRFFDIVIDLPDVERKQLINFTIETLGIQAYFERTNDEAGRRELRNVVAILTAFLDSPDLSLRTIEQSLNRLGVLFASLRSDVRALGVTATVALVLRTHNYSLFQQFVKGEADDAELADSLFALPGIEKLRLEPIGEFLEAYIVLAGLEIKDVKNYRLWPESSPLWRRYEEELSKHEEGTPYSRYEHSVSNVRRNVEQLSDRGYSYHSIGFGTAVRRLELLSNDLLEH